MGEVHESSGCSNFAMDDTGQVLILTDKQHIQVVRLGHTKSISVINELYCEVLQVYPFGPEVFTASSASFGLKVFDSTRGKVVFAYKPDVVRSHRYREDGTVVGITKSGIKVYDLRIRYSVQFLPVKGIEKCVYKAGDFYASTEAGVVRVNSRLDAENTVLANILDLGFVQNDLFCVYRLNDEFFLRNFMDSTQVISFGENIVESADEANCYYQFNEQSVLSAHKAGYARSDNLCKKDITQLVSTSSGAFFSDGFSVYRL